VSSQPLRIRYDANTASSVNGCDSAAHAAAESDVTTESKSRFRRLFASVLRLRLAFRFLLLPGDLPLLLPGDLPLLLAGDSRLRLSLPFLLLFLLLFFLLFVLLFVLIFVLDLDCDSQTAVRSGLSCLTTYFLTKPGTCNHM